MNIIDYVNFNLRYPDLVSEEEFDHYNLLAFNILKYFLINIEQYSDDINIQEALIEEIKFLIDNEALLNMPQGISSISVISFSMSLQNDNIKFINSVTSPKAYILIRGYISARLDSSCGRCL